MNTTVPPSETRALLRLSAPLVVAQLAQMAMGVAGTLVAGQLGVRALAAQALGATTFTFVLITGYGLMAGLDPHISRFVGAGRPDEAGRLLRQGLWLAVLAGLPLTGLLLAAGPILRAMGQDPALMDIAESYLRWSAVGLIPALWFCAYRSFASAANKPRIIMASAVLANIVHVGLCVWLAYGGAGVPAMGVAGIGLASVLCRLLLVAMLALYCRHSTAFASFRGRLELPRLDLLMPLLRSGLPLGLQYGLEVTGFVLVTLWMGLLGADVLAAHEVALSATALAFQVPFAIGTAAAMRVGHAIGRGDEPGVARAGWTALRVGVLYAVTSAIAMVLLREWIALRYMPTATPPVLEMAKGFLAIGACFQLADGAQAIGFGVLRGLDDTRVPVLFNVLGFALLGLPLGYVGVFVLHLSPAWMWYGLTLALFVVASLLALRFRSLVLTRRGRLQTEPTRVRLASTLKDSLAPALD
jgi:MATE family multidrug resistance protein